MKPWQRLSRGRRNRRFPIAAPNPPVARAARRYQAVHRDVVNWSQYPAIGIDSLARSLHDISFLQGLFANDNNFATASFVEVFELRLTGNNDMVGEWKRIDDEASMVNYAQSLEQVDGDLKLRAIFCTLEHYHETSYGLQLSLTKKSALEILSRLHVCPQFCHIMLGEPDYWAPLNIKTNRSDGTILRVEFTCQHPRYAIHSRQEPCSVYLSYDIETSRTIYVVAHGIGEEWVHRAKNRFSSYFIRQSPVSSSALSEARDPFLLQSILCHESLVEAKKPITELRHKLYDVLDIVGEYSKEPFDRSNLKEMTNLLHKVSQDADSLFVSAEMGTMVAQHSLDGRKSISPVGASSSHVIESLVYLIQSLDSQKRWLQSYKSRKDIAMNLVFNLVTQQDSETSTDIARDTKDDSANMKIIAVLTMAFLPATAVSGFFGMSFFGVSDDGKFLLSNKVWIFGAITVPLTMCTFFLWLFWYPVMKAVQRCSSR